jgi:hypothetical protein
MRKKEICPKCKELRYPHQHHILPKVLFGKVGFIHRMCSDCHEEYHEDLGKKSLMQEHPPIFYVEHFIRWMGAIAIILYIVVNIYR